MFARLPAVGVTPPPLATDRLVGLPAQPGLASGRGWEVGLQRYLQTAESDLHPEKLADALVCWVVEGLDVPVAFVLLRDEERCAFVVGAYQGLREPALLSVGAERPLWGWLARQGRAIWWDELQALPQWRGLLQREKVALERSDVTLVVPLARAKTLLAVLGLGRKHGRGSFSQKEVRQLEVAAAHTALGLENACLYQEARRSLYELQTISEQVGQAARLAAIGELTSGVAHEVATHLQAMVNLTYLLRQGSSREDPRWSDLEALEEVVLQARQTVSGVLDLAHGGDGQWRTEEVNGLVRSVLSAASLYREVGRIQLALELAESLSPVWADGQQLKQVFLNLLTNAVDAIEGAGTITVSTAYEDGRVIVQFKDSGRGILPRNLSRVFEPFFTEKSVGRGTGRGLAVSKRIVERHGGSLVVQSRVGEGTTFSVSLPALIPEGNYDG